MQRPHPPWVDAMNQELMALEANETRTLVDLPPGKRKKRALT